MPRRCPIFALVLVQLAAVGPSRAQTEASIKEWDVPTPNSRPHDPAFAPDGALWYTGQLANKLGRLDPKSGRIQEYTLKTANSGPHGLIADRDGNIWYTANSAAHIGKLNPETGEITEYRMPDARAQDPHTPIFDAKGLLWFTVQNGNFVGKLDPRTGVVTLRQSPTPSSRPYGIAIDSTGVPFYCENNTNKIGRIDPDTLQITEYTLPSSARPRRLTITPDDIVYYADDRGTLGRLDPRSGSVEALLSPGGAVSAPYGITSTPDGIVWYCETGLQPNNLVRFDPRSKTFETWPIPSGGGVVRHMVSTPERNLYIACSGVNKVGIVYPSNQRAFSIADRGAVSWTSSGAAGPALVGYGRIVPDASSAAPAGMAVIALRQDGVLVSEAAVAAAPRVASGRIHAEVKGRVRTGIAIANPNDEPATLSFYFTDSSGRDSDRRSTTLAANSQIAAFLDQAPFEGGSSIEGSFTFSSTLSVSASALRGLVNERSEFLIAPLPVVDLAATNQDVLLIPQFADGAGWTTEIVLVNPSNAAASGSLQFFSQGSATESGQPLTLTVDGTSGSSFAYSIAPGASQRLETSGSGAGLRVGSVRLTPAAGTRAPWGSAIVSFRRDGTTVSLAGVPAVRAASAFRVYAEASGSADAVATGIAIANASASPATVDLELFTLEGASTGLKGSIALAGQGQTALFSSEIAGLSSVSLPFQGVLRVTTASAAGVAVAGIRGRTNERGDFLIASTPPVEESSSAGAAESLFPHLVDAGGYTTQFILMAAAPGKSSTGAVRFLGANGVSLGLLLR